MNCSRSFCSESDLYLQLQQLQRPSVGASASATPLQRGDVPLQRGDVLVQVQALLPLAGTWRVVAGLGNFMLAHVGDVVAVHAAPKVLEQRPTDAASLLGAQRPRLQLPEAFESDSDEQSSALGTCASARDAHVCAETGDGEVQDSLSVRGAGVLTERRGSSVGGEAAMSYTHSGGCCLL